MIGVREGTMVSENNLIPLNDTLVHKYVTRRNHRRQLSHKVRYKRQSAESLRVRPAISLTERFGSYGLMVRCPVCHSGNMTTDKTLALHYTAHVVMPGLGESVTDMNVGIEDA